MKIAKQIVFIVFLILGAADCAPKAGPHKEVRGLQTAEKTSALGYDDVRPIFANHCSACHPSRSAPDWLDYSQIGSYVKNGALLRRVVIERSMPPPGSREAAAMSDEQRQLIGEWVRIGGLLKPQADSSRGQASFQRPLVPTMDVTVQRCLTCHGVRGPQAASQSSIPRLNGQSQKYLRSQLSAFKWGERIDPSHTMNDIAIDLSDDDMETAVDYFANLKGLGPGGAEPLLDGKRKFYARGKEEAVQSCISCHMNPEYSGKPTSDELPILAGQSKRYLLQQLIMFRNDQRSVPVMNELVKGLTNEDLDALATYFATER